MIKSTFLKSGMTGIIRISAKKAICLDKFSVLSSIGRFTLRDENRTIGFGEVEKLKPALKF